MGRKRRTDHDPAIIDRMALQAYTTISKRIVLTGEIYKMSVKDIATLYEYWTFLKLGGILSGKCRRVGQNVVEFNLDRLFISLDKTCTAEQKYKHPVTKEEVILRYQFDTTSNRVPTVQQKHDTMLSIGKRKEPISISINMFLMRNIG